jgi:hypothetical protein
MPHFGLTANKEAQSRFDLAIRTRKSVLARYLLRKQDIHLERRLPGRRNLASLFTAQRSSRCYSEIPGGRRDIG